MHPGVPLGLPFTFEVSAIDSIQAAIEHGMHCCNWLTNGGAGAYIIASGLAVYAVRFGLFPIATISLQVTLIDGVGGKKLPHVTVFRVDGLQNTPLTEDVSQFAQLLCDFVSSDTDPEKLISFRKTQISELVTLANSR